jgi:hypothetical protein
MITVNVTANHIARGVKKSRCYCPIALALRETFGQNSDPRVDKVYLALGTLTTYQAPPEVRDFIDTFDATGWGKPFSFQLEPIQNRYR